jgi:DNA repair protein RecN (Recombination protein N)
VICVTHLPQIACFADAHLRIAKRVDGDRTSTSIARLDDEERVSELGVMLGGSESSDRARANARELIERATEWKSARSVDRRPTDSPVAAAGR